MNIKKEKIQNISIIILIISIILFLVVDFIGEKITNNSKASINKNAANKKGSIFTLSRQVSINTSFKRSIYFHPFIICTLNKFTLYFRCCICIWQDFFSDWGFFSLSFPDFAYFYTKRYHMKCLKLTCSMWYLLYYITISNYFLI